MNCLQPWLHRFMKTHISVSLTLVCQQWCFTHEVQSCLLQTRKCSWVLLSELEHNRWKSALTWSRRAGWTVSMFSVDEKALLQTFRAHAELLPSRRDKRTFSQPCLHHPKTSRTPSVDISNMYCSPLGSYPPPRPILTSNRRTTRIIKAVGPELIPSLLLRQSHEELFVGVKGHLQ